MNNFSLKKINILLILIIIISFSFAGKTNAQQLSPLQTNETTVTPTNARLEGSLIINQEINLVGFYIGISEDDVINTECNISNYIVPNSDDSTPWYTTVSGDDSYTYTNQTNDIFQNLDLINSGFPIGQTIYYKVCGEHNRTVSPAIKVEGEVKSFITPEPTNTEIVITTEGYGNISTNRVRLEVSSNANDDLEAFGFNLTFNTNDLIVLNENNPPGLDDLSINGCNLSSEPINPNLSIFSQDFDLEFGRTYYYQGCARDNQGNILKGSVKTITVPASDSDEVQLECKIDYIEFSENRHTTPLNSGKFDNFLLSEGRDMNINIYAKDAQKCNGVSLYGFKIVDIRSEFNLIDPSIRMNPYNTSISAKEFNETGIITLKNIHAGSYINNGVLGFNDTCPKNTQCMFGLQFDYGSTSAPQRFRSWVTSNPGGLATVHSWPDTIEKRDKGIVWFKSIDGTRTWKSNTCRFDPGDITFDTISEDLTSDRIVTLKINTKYCKDFPITLKIKEQDSNALTDALTGSLQAALYAAGEEAAVVGGLAAAGSLITTGSVSAAAIAGTTAIGAVSATGVGAIALGFAALYLANSQIDDKIQLNYQNESVEELILYPHPIDNNLFFRFKTTEDECEKRSDDDEDLPDCVYYAIVSIGENGTPYAFPILIPLYELDDNWKEVKTFTEQGLLLGNCSSDDCDNDEPWQVLGTNGFTEQTTAEDVSGQGGFIDYESICYDESLGGYDPNCYEFLAAIPGLDQFANVEKEGNRVAITNLQEFELGAYVNTLFQIILGLIMVLAVIMIIIAGVQYMTVESLYGKSSARTRITGAVTGLILSLGIFIILNTINPELLNINFGANIEGVAITVTDPAELDGDGTSQTVSNAPATQICNNRKDRGYWKGQTELKLAKINETAQNVALGSLVSPGVVISTGVPQGTTIANKVENGFSIRVKNMINALNQEQITTRVTEAFGPSFLGHGSPCHYLGSCIDLATTNSTYSADIVEKIIRKADANGLTAQFEFSNSQSQETYTEMQDELATRNIDKCMIKYVTNATNWHFSVYDKITPSLTL